MRSTWSHDIYKAAIKINWHLDHLTLDQFLFNCAIISKLPFKLLICHFEKDLSIISLCIQFYKGILEYGCCQNYV